MGRATLRWGTARSRLRLLPDERGVALVEFALVLPLLLLLLLGMIDVGKAVNYWNDETHLANEAARYVAVNKSPDPRWAASPPNSLKNPAYKVNQTMNAQADSGELQNGGGSISPPGINVAICFPNGTHNVGDPVRVTVTATYNWLAYLVQKTGIAPTTLTGKSTMRIEQAPVDPSPANKNTSSDAYYAAAC
jgi:Flp pilus assembly protein TadG